MDNLTNPHAAFSPPSLYVPLSLEGKNYLVQRKEHGIISAAMDDETLSPPERVIYAGALLRLAISDGKAREVYISGMPGTSAYERQITEELSKIYNYDRRIHNARTGDESGDGSPV